MLRLITFACLSLFLAFGLLAFNGCDKPEINPGNYGTLLNNASEVNESGEKIPVPDIEGVDMDYLKQYR